MLLCFIPSASAASEEANIAAASLYQLGLMQGKGRDANGDIIFDLDAFPTREEATTMFVRLLGKEEEAKASTSYIPFTDVSEWAKPYVSYAYTHGLVRGTSDTEFSGKALITAHQYLTLVLRALDYSDTTDFSWDQSYVLANQIGLTDGRYDIYGYITRGDLSWISFSALKVRPKDEYKFLYMVLEEEGKLKECEALNLLKAYRLPSPVKVSNIRYSVDYVGGWTFTFDLVNNGTKPIKYVTLFWYCYNAVGDPIEDMITGDDYFSVKITGPINPGEGRKDMYNYTPFYSYDFAGQIFVDEIDIEYMDGTEEVVTSDTYQNYWDLE